SATSMRQGNSILGDYTMHEDADHSSNTTTNSDNLGQFSFSTSTADATDTTDVTGNSITGDFDQTVVTHTDSTADESVTTIANWEDGSTPIVSNVLTPLSSADKTTHTAGNSISGEYDEDVTSTSHAQRLESSINQTLEQTANRFTDTESSSTD